MTELSKNMMRISKRRTHYDFEYKGVLMDPYRISEIYGLGGCQEHIVKKGLRAGQGHKTLRQDIQDIIDTAERWLEMLDEDERAEDDHK